MDDNGDREQESHKMAEKISDELEHMVHRQRTRRIAFQIGLLLVAHAFIVIALVADQISAFTEVRLEEDNTRITNNRYCGLTSLYSKSDDITIHPSLTEGSKKSWRFADAEEECVPSPSDDAEALAVCESLVDFNEKLSTYILLMVVAFSISILNLLIHCYRLYKHFKKNDFNPEDEPLRMWICAPAKMVYWFECLLYVGSCTCLIMSVFWFPGVAKDTYCYDSDYTGICEGDYVLTQLTCGWQLGSSNFHILVCAFFQFVGALIKLKQLLCTHMISYKSRLVFPDKANTSISLEELKK